MPLKILLVVLIFALPLIPTFWAILDIPKRQFSSVKAKLLWFGLVATLPFIGAMIYIFLGRRHTQPLQDPTPPTPREEDIRTDA
ncbi:MAG: PLD nuclease N-terminal domain-containing protein [Syntrophobacteraceae bacterium]